MQLMFDT